jgi:hypothetical protein
MTRLPLSQTLRDSLRDSMSDSMRDSMRDSMSKSTKYSKYLMENKSISELTTICIENGKNNLERDYFMFHNRGKKHKSTLSGSGKPLEAFLSLIGAPPTQTPETPHNQTPNQPQWLPNDVVKIFHYIGQETLAKLGCDEIYPYPCITITGDRTAVTGGQLEWLYKLGFDCGKSQTICPQLVVFLGRGFLSAQSGNHPPETDPIEVLIVSWIGMDGVGQTLAFEFKRGTCGCGCGHEVIEWGNIGTLWDSKLDERINTIENGDTNKETPCTGDNSSEGAIGSICSKFWIGWLDGVEKTT